MAADQLGISSAQSTAATGGLLGLLKNSMGGNEFSGLLGNLCGASGVLNQVMGAASGGSHAATGSSGGGLSGLAGSLGGLLGGGGGGHSSGGGIAGALGGLLAGGHSGGSSGGSNPLAAIGSLLGGNSGNALGAMAMLSQAGLSMDKIGPFVQMFMGYVQSNAGDSAQSSILGALPDLKKLLG